MSHPSDRGFELFRRDPGVKRRRELCVKAIRQTESENKEIGFVGGNLQSPMHGALYLTGDETQYRTPG